MEPRTVYLDNNATTAVAPEVVAAMLPLFEKCYANPSSMHFLGWEAAKYVERAREQVSNLLGCRPTEIVFTGCGSESDILAVRGVAELLPPGRRHLVTTEVEHPAVKAAMEYLSQRGYELSVLGVNAEGRLDLEELKAAVTDRTGLVSVMYANNETGVLFPIEEIGRVVKSKGAVFHVDAVQAVGKIPIHLADSTADLLSIAGHKFHAPKGVGALYVRKGVRLQPLILGGHQEGGVRAGTEAVPNIVGLGAAAELAQKNLAQKDMSLLSRRHRLEEFILKNIPETRLNGHKEERLPNTCNIAFRRLEGEAILLALSKAGICASAGSACTSGSLEPSRILKAMKVPADYIYGSIRFSLSRYTTEEEVDYAVATLPQVIEKLRKIARAKV